jgi:hypothetical protein
VLFHAIDFFVLTMCISLRGGFPHDRFFCTNNVVYRGSCCFPRDEFFYQQCVEATWLVLFHAIDFFVPTTMAKAYVARGDFRAIDFFVLTIDV